MNKIPNFGKVVQRQVILPKTIEFIEGDVFTDKAFMSSSKDMSYEFIDFRYHNSKINNGYRIIIKSKSGKDISKISTIKEEQEVLFNTDIKLRIDKIIDKKVYKVIYCTEL